jgi:hypothetical protein
MAGILSSLHSRHRRQGVQPPFRRTLLQTVLSLKIPVHFTGEPVRSATLAYNPRHICPPRLFLPSRNSAHLLSLPSHHCFGIHKMAGDTNKRDQTKQRHEQQRSRLVTAERPPPAKHPTRTTKSSTPPSRSLEPPRTVIRAMVPAVPHRASTAVRCHPACTIASSTYLRNCTISSLICQCSQISTITSASRAATNR